jgi:hypothetical protein
MNIEQQQHIVGDRIDTLIALDIPARGVIGQLYAMARDRCNAPLCLQAARKLKNALQGKGTVFIVTGWHDRPAINSKIAETDGPLGAVVLATALHKVAGIIPFVLVADNLVNSVKALLCAVGLKPLEIEEALTGTEKSPSPVHTGVVLEFPKNSAQAQSRAKHLLETYQPGAVIAIEVGGINEQGAIHTFRGEVVTDENPKFDHLFRQASEAGILTIGIGDGGNELGFGSIHDQVAEEIPKGEDAKGGGIAPITPVDVLVPAAVSNWGAYGIVANLAFLERNIALAHTLEQEQRLLATSVQQGLIDGISGYVHPSVDGLAASIHQSVITLLKQVVASALEKLENDCKN